MEISTKYITELEQLAEKLNLEEFKVIDDGTCLDITYNSPNICKTERFMQLISENHELRFLELEARTLNHSRKDSLRYRWNAL